jgi:DNA-binding GntR family transcriptional regulator
MALEGDGRMAGGLRSLPRDTLRDRVYEGLRNSLLRGSFEPGEPLTVRSLATAFGTSPTPVREALQQLVAEQALTAEPNRSYRIPRVSRETFLEVRDIRVELEGLAAANAAAHIRPATLRRLELAVERMGKAIRSQDLKTYLAANQAFHFIVYEASGSPILLRTISSLWLLIGPSLNMLFSDLELVEGLQDQHHAVIEAFRRGDADAARRAVQADILAAGMHIGRQMSEPGSSTSS